MDRRLGEEESINRTSPSAPPIGAEHAPRRERGDAAHAISGAMQPLRATARWPKRSGAIRDPRRPPRHPLAASAAATPAYAPARRERDMFIHQPIKDLT